MDELKGKILITGGAGTLGRAIIKRAVEKDWDCDITIFSTDPVKHARVKKQYPQVQSLIGDIRQYETLYAAMTGKDIVIHAAAVKEIPTGEYNSIDTFQINVEGSVNVAMAAAQLNTPHVLAISTDKACHAANAYGSTKYLMEKIWQEYARMGLPTKYHLVRYGNVIESSASVLENWRRAVANGEAVKITNPNMTRFWLSPSQAVAHVITSLNFNPGMIYIPRMPGLSIGKLLEYTVGKYDKVETIPLRPGEKMNETLLTLEETDFALSLPDGWGLAPTTSERFGWKEEELKTPYTSDVAKQLTKEELEELLNG